MYISISLAAIACGGGICSHLVLFRRGEWHLQGLRLLQALVMVLTALTLYLQFRINLTWAQSTSSAMIIASSYLVGLFSSITLYRVFFHPLRSFPGPRLAAVSKFWHVWQLGFSKNHDLLDRLRLEYGDYVRTGPNELTVFDPEIMHSNSSYRSTGLSKSDWYEFLHPFRPLNAIRDAKEHDVRRRIWNQAFNAKALEAYDECVHEYADKLNREIELRLGSPMELRNWFYFLTFDIIGFLTFGRSFGMLDTGKWHSGPAVIRKGLRLLSWATPVPWLAHMAFKFPMIPVIADWTRMVTYCRKQMADRIDAELSKTEKPSRDISTAIIEGSVQRGTLQQDMELILGDSIALMIAGSDTVASTLVHVFYRLCRHGEAAKRLIDELRSLKQTPSQHALQELRYLGVFINETLRLHPAVPTGALRQAPAEGLHVSGRWIAPGTILCIPQRCLHRSTACFVRADDFLPERWLDQPELIKNKLAYAPFSAGRFNCVGQGLAMAELRYVLWSIISKYDFAPANPPTLDLVDHDMKDAFTALPGSLEMIFRKAEVN